MLSNFLKAFQRRKWLKNQIWVVSLLEKNKTFSPVLLHKKFHNRYLITHHVIWFHNLLKRFNVILHLMCNAVLYCYTEHLTKHLFMISAVITQTLPVSLRLTAVQSSSSWGAIYPFRLLSRLLSRRESPSEALLLAVSQRRGRSHFRLNEAPCESAGSRGDRRTE